VGTEADIAVDDLAAPADDEERANLVFVGVILGLLHSQAARRVPRFAWVCRLRANRNQDAPLLQIKPSEVE